MLHQAGQQHLISLELAILIVTAKRGLPTPASLKGDAQWHELQFSKCSEQ
jgi:hypothetical protein